MYKTLKGKIRKRGKKVFLIPYSDPEAKYLLVFPEAQKNLSNFFFNRAEVWVNGYLENNNTFRVIKIEKIINSFSVKDIKKMAERTGITLDISKIEAEFSNANVITLNELMQQIQNNSYTPLYPEVVTQLEAIFSKVQQNTEILELNNLLENYNFDIPTVYSIYDTFVKRARYNNTTVPALIKENPYILLQAQDTNLNLGVVNQLAEQANFSSEKRKLFSCMTEILVFINQAQYKGHNFTFVNAIYSHLLKKYDKETIQKAFRELSSDQYKTKFGQIKILKWDTYGVKENGQEFFKDNKESSAVYLVSTFFNEYNAGKHTASMLSREFKGDLNLSEVNEILNFSRFKNLSEKQKEFIKKVASNKITVLTGGPGTGKTTAIHALIDIAHTITGKIPLVLAPTAIAAFRASEGTIAKENAGTIHRLMKIISSEADDFVDLKTNINIEENQITNPVVIIDESSMLTPLTMSRILPYISPQTHVVFAGDPNQLPPVRTGGIFQGLIDLAKNSSIPNIDIVELKEQFRSNDNLLENAYKVLEGKEISFGESVLCKTLDKKQGSINDILIPVIKEIMEAEGITEFNPNTLLVLTPTNTELAGTINLNKILSRYFNPHGIKITDDFKEGDWVINTRNDYEDVVTLAFRHPQRGTVYNGERGRIIGYDPETDEVVVEYYTAGYTRQEIYNSSELKYFLQLGYATTVHKAQGTQGKYTILILLNSQNNRRLIFTALTRTMKDGKAIIISDEQFIEEFPYINSRIMPTLSRFKYIVLENLQNSEYTNKIKSKTVHQSLLEWEKQIAEIAVGTEPNF